jgi:hypothetical protein
MTYFCKVGRDGLKSAFNALSRQSHFSTKGKRKPLFVGITFLYSRVNNKIGRAVEKMSSY